MDHVVPDPSNLDFTTQTAPDRESLPIIAARPRASLVGNRHCVVVDPDRIEGRWTAQALQRLGLQVEVETSPEAVRERIEREGEPCLVVLELKIPGALDLVAWLRASEGLRDAAVVAYTWCGDRKTLSAALAADVDGCVLKTGDPAPLLRAVRRVLRTSRDDPDHAAGAGISRFARLCQSRAA